VTLSSLRVKMEGKEESFCHLEIFSMHRLRVAVFGSGKISLLHSSALISMHNFYWRVM
jgi:hypothetical protein